MRKNVYEEVNDINAAIDLSEQASKLQCRLSYSKERGVEGWTLVTPANHRDRTFNAAIDLKHFMDGMELAKQIALNPSGR